MNILKTRDLIVIEDVPYEGQKYDSYDLVSSNHDGSCCFFFKIGDKKVDTKLYGYGQHALSNDSDLFYQTIKGIKTLEFLKKRVLKCEEIDEIVEKLLEKSVIFFNIYTLNTLFLDKDKLFEMYGEFRDVEILGKISKGLLQVRFDEKVVCMHDSITKFNTKHEVVALLPHMSWPNFTDETQLALTLIHKEVL